MRLHLSLTFVEVEADDGNGESEIKLVDQHALNDVGIFRFPLAHNFR